MNFTLFVILALTAAGSAFTSSSFVRNSLKRAVVPAKRLTNIPSANFASKRPDRNSRNAALLSLGAIGAVCAASIDQSQAEAQRPDLQSYEPKTLEYEFYNSYHIQKNDLVVLDYFLAAQYVRSMNLDFYSFEALIKVLDADFLEKSTVAVIEVGNVEEVICELFKKIGCSKNMARYAFERINFKSNKVGIPLYYLAHFIPSSADTCQKTNFGEFF